MIDPAKPSDESQLEAYLDHALNDVQQAALAAAYRDNANAKRQIQLQRAIDESLEQSFRVEGPTADELASLLVRSAQSDVPATQGNGPRLTRRWWASAAALAAAATMGWYVLVNSWLGSNGERSHFAARPLTELYRESVANGFEPTYECHEPERFADTFNRRQGQPLKLLPLPPGVQMLGLAYLGGLSRSTTAMLCRVDGHPVMVFVDRAAANESAARRENDDALHVFRSERNGLVYFEVTPLDEARVLAFLAPVE